MATTFSEGTGCSGACRAGDRTHRPRSRSAGTRVRPIAPSREPSPTEIGGTIVTAGPPCGALSRAHSQSGRGAARHDVYCYSVFTLSPHAGTGRDRNGQDAQLRCRRRLPEVDLHQLRRAPERGPAHYIAQDAIYTSRQRRRRPRDAARGEVREASGPPHRSRGTRWPSASRPITAHRSLPLPVVGSRFFVGTENGEVHAGGRPGAAPIVWSRSAFFRRLRRCRTGSRRRQPGCFKVFGGLQRLDPGRHDRRVQPVPRAQPERPGARSRAFRTPQWEP